jgi:putative ABC transport system permease protein
VSTFDESLRRVTDSPLTTTIKSSFVVVTIALAVYALLAVLIALVVGAAERSRALSYLRTLGLSERQAANLTVLEIAPLIVLTACAGLVLGLALPAALGPGLDLSAYAGDLAVRTYELSLTTPVLLAAGLAAVALAGAFLHAVIGRRRSLGSILRVGE